MPHQCSERSVYERICVSCSHIPRNSHIQEGHFPVFLDPHSLLLQMRTLWTTATGPRSSISTAPTRKLLCQKATLRYSPPSSLLSLVLAEMLARATDNVCNIHVHCLAWSTFECIFHEMELGVGKCTFGLSGPLPSTPSRPS